MHYSKVIFLFSLIAIPIFTFAQNQPQIKIGANGVPHGINEIGITETISAANFTKDGTLYITKKNKTYTIENFEISILPEGSRSDVIGPLIISTSNGMGNISNINNISVIKNYLHDGTRIYIENIIASCTECTEMKNVIVKALSLKLDQ